LRLNLLDILLCPNCGGALTCAPFEIKSVEPDFRHFCRSWCAAKGIDIESRSPGAAVDPEIARRIQFQAPAAIDREDCRLCHQADVVEGILTCPPCRKTFPVIGTIPEVLPDELRNAERESSFMATHKDRIEGRASFAGKIDAAASGTAPPPSPDNWTFKKAEIILTRRPDLPPGFFTPGHFVPFEPQHPIRSIEKILRFMVSVHDLKLRFGDFILDLGVGYAWTTEWLKKLGYNPIGVDLNREYLQVGLERTGHKLPPLLIADVENLPLRKSLFQGMLFFDAFHHLANREKCLRNLAELLVPGGLLIMAEPGQHHEAHPASVQVMKSYGILERGITEKELRRMIKDTPFEKVQKFPYEFGDVEILLLKKAGQRVYTSKAPDFLNARIVPETTAATSKPGQPIPLRLDVRNTGNTLWIHKTEDVIGEVRIGVQLKTPERGMIDDNYLRIPLPKDISPGESIRLEALLPPVAEPGDYILEIDGVSEGIIWFKDVSYNPVAVSLKVRP